MSYSPAWTNGSPEGRLAPGVHFVRDDDPGEIAAGINRRRRLIYLPEQDFSSQIGPGKSVRAATLATQMPPPFKHLRGAIDVDILEPTTVLGGDPPTPTAMDWLWPVADQDENKVLVACYPGAGEVALLEKINGTGQWTDPALTGGATAVRAVHHNELRQAVEWIIRGRWQLPIYLPCGIFSVLPNTPWLGESIANNGSDELRSLGFAVIRTSDQPTLGLSNVTVRPGTRIELTADTDCQAQVYRCLRGIDFSGDPPTWNECAPGQSQAWSQPGGTGEGDATVIGSVDLTAGQSGQLSNQALTQAVQAMIDGGEQNFLIRRSDTGYETIAISAELVIEFDLNSPPN